MVKSAAARLASLEQKTEAVLAKLDAIKKAKQVNFTATASVKLWRIFGGKKMIDHIRQRWSSEQLAHMTLRARSEPHMTVTQKAAGSQLVTPARLESHLATNLAACFFIVATRISSRKADEEACKVLLSDSRLAEKPWEVLLEGDAVRDAISRWQFGGDEVKDGV